MSGLPLLLLWAWLMASSFVVSAFVVPYASPLAAAAVRFVCSLLLMTLVLMFHWRRAGRKESQPWRAMFCDKYHIGRYLLISGALVGFFIGLFTALQSTTPLHTSVLYTLIPLISLVMARVWFHEALSRWRVLGFVMGSMGATLVLFASHGEASFVWNQGDSLFLGACVLLAFHVVAVQRWGGSVAPLQGAFMMMFCGCLWLLPIALLWGDLGQVQWQSFGFWGAIVYLTVFTTLMTFILQQRLVAQLGASHLLAFSYTVPIWVAFYSAFSYGRWAELWRVDFLLGVLSVLSALVLITRYGMNRSSAVTSN